jgi:hypothetical protein
MPRLFQPTYTKPIPEGARIFTRRGKRFARFRDRGGNVVDVPLTDAGDRIIRTSDTWHAEFKDQNGKWQRKPLSRNKEAAQAMFGDLVRRVERQQGGLTDPFEDERRRPLAEHLGDYERYLISKGNTAKHARMTRRRVQAAADGCGWVFTSDISAVELLGWVRDERARRAAAVEEAARGERVQRMSAATANYYVREVKGFWWDRADACRRIP